MSLFQLLLRIYRVSSPPTVTKSTDSPPLKFGILGAANIAKSAFVDPAKSHPEVIVHAVAARDPAKAAKYAKDHGIEKHYGGPTAYQELLDDPEIQAVYNPLPNGLHFEWTMKALAAGKHVLLEKPATNTAEDARQLFDFAEKKGLILMEAFHYRFHPAIQRTKAILDSGELGAIKSISTSLALPERFFKKDDIRFQHALGGGAVMDMGCYALSSARYLAGSAPKSVLSTNVETAAENVDRKTVATLEFPKDVIATLTCDLAIPPSYGFIPSMPDFNAIVECEGGKVELYNYLVPTLYHTLTVTKTAGSGRAAQVRKEKVYTFPEGKMDAVKGENDWWSTYRYQLEAFVNRVKGRPTQTWVDREDSIENMVWIEKIYEKSGLGIRPKSNFVL